jgi:hypothetical protein
MPMFRTSTAQLTKAEKLLAILRDHDWHSTGELGAVPNSRRLPTVAGSAAELVRRGKA